MTTKYSAVPEHIVAFQRAIDAGRMTNSPITYHLDGRTPWAGDYIYMGTVDGRDLFKHIDTREYLP